MLEQIRSLIAAALDERKSADDKIQSILDGVERDERSEMTDDETKAFDEARSAVKAADDRLAELEAREADLVELAERRAKADEARSRIAQSAPERVVTVNSEERTYRPDNGHDFIADAYRSKFHGDRAAQERVERARAEALADYRSTTGNFGGLVVPQYLTALYAENLKSGRPFLENVNQVPLPAEGMTLTIPRGATPTAVAAQETQNTAVNNQTIVVTDLVVPVRTFAGQQLVSRQAVDRGQGIANVILADLFSDYATRVNVSAIAGAGTGGGHFGILNTTSVQTAAWTGTTGASLVASIHNAIGKVNAARYAAATRIFMHPRRWAWLCAQSDTSGRPLVQIDGPGFNAQGNGSAAGYGVVGSVAGIPVVTDAGVPITLGVSTDEDRIIVTRASDVLFMEDAAAPVGLNLEEVKATQLSIEMVVYGYSAFTAGRWPVATCNIQGTGFKQVLT
jgi:HK97 family phage major capsid protein